MPEVRIDVIANTHGAPAQLQQTETALAGIQRQGVAADAALGGVWKQFAAGAIAAGLVEKGVRAFTSACMDSVKAAIEAERVDRALESALQITGRATSGASRGLSMFASELQKVTIYDDEAIKSAQALIIQMRGTTDGLKDATKGAIGLASVFGMDLQSAARAVAQGMEGNYIMLGRLIPAIREAKTESEKHAAMMQALAGYYERAEADAETFGGKLDSLKHVYNDLQETIGGFVTKNKDVIATLSGVKEIIIWLDRNVKTLENRKGLDLGWAFAPTAILKALKGVGDAAAASNKAYAESWEGLSLAVLQASPAIDPLPIKILDTSESTRKAEEAFIALSRAIQVAHSAAKSIDPIPFRLFGDFDADKSLYQLTQLPDVVSDIARIIGDPANAPDLTSWDWEFKDTAEKAKETIGKIVDFSQQAFSMMDGIFAQSQKNREIAIENEYKTRLMAIEASIQDEEARAQAVEALEAEYQIKRTSARRAAAKEQKAVAMMEAIVNTASAVAEALPNLILAGIVAAMGAVQVATIAAQPIPLAKGAYFDQPTILPGMDGQRYLVDEEIGNPGEIVSPVPMLRRIVREESGAGAAGAQVTLNFNAPLIATSGLADADLMRARDRLLDAINKGLRDIGHRTI